LTRARVRASDAFLETIEEMLEEGPE